jgi:dUTP pyrophosphatase
LGKDPKRIRGFEIISAFKNREITIPTRKTRESAGYDIESAEDVTIPAHGFALVPTGLKAYMRTDEYLGIHIRSSISFRHGLSLMNDQGIIDADYYNNPDNEGHIIIGIINHSSETVAIGRGERIAQGIFKKYYVTDGDTVLETRSGGIGSTGT